MTRNRFIPWLRICAESVAIVGSILLAFAIDAWWDERLERRLEAQQLERLHVELATNIERIDEFLIGARIVSTGLAIISQIEGELSRDSQITIVPATELRLLTIAPTFEADLSVFNGLVQSGRLDVIRDTGVVSALTAWEREYINYRELGELARETTESRLLPALHKRADTADVVIRSGSNIAEGELAALPDVSITIDTEIKGLIGQKVANQRQAENLLMTARDAAEFALDAVDSAQVR